MSRLDKNLGLDELDRLILNQIQSDFPVAAHPYQVMGEPLGLTEDETLMRVNRMREIGVIRRLGGNFFPGKMGYTSTLCAAKVPADKLDAFIEVVNGFDGVTHNYLRTNAFNVWFTFIAKGADEIEAGLREIASKTGVTEIYNLPAERVFKIKVDFQFD